MSTFPLLTQNNVIQVAFCHRQLVHMRDQASKLQNIWLSELLVSWEGGTQSDKKKQWYAAALRLVPTIVCATLEYLYIHVYVQYVHVHVSKWSPFTFV